MHMPTAPLRLHGKASAYDTVCETGAHCAKEHIACCATGGPMLSVMIAYAAVGNQQGACEGGERH